jgi:hypothetical protein
MKQRMRFLGSLPKYADMHEIHVIIDCTRLTFAATSGRWWTRSAAAIHFIPPGLTDIVQPLDRAVFGALKAGYRAIDRYEMSQKEDKSVTKADFAAYLLLAWELASEDAIQRGWECPRPDTGGLELELEAGLAE